MKKLIAIGILSAVTTLMGILVIENIFEEKSIETREESFKRILNHQEETKIEEYGLR